MSTFITRIGSSDERQKPGVVMILSYQCYTISAKTNARPGAREIVARSQTTQPQGGGKLTPRLPTLSRWTQRPVGRGGACLRPGPGPSLQQSYAHPTSPGGDVAELCEPELQQCPSATTTPSFLCSYRSRTGCAW